MQYEDFVPPQVETALGGFYINTGQLDFKCRTDLDPEWVLLPHPSLPPSFPPPINTLYLHCVCSDCREADFVLKKKKPKLKKNLSHHKILARWA